MEAAVPECRTQNCKAGMHSRPLKRQLCKLCSSQVLDGIVLLPDPAGLVSAPPSSRELTNLRSARRTSSLGERFFIAQWRV